jgi:hypothetical protein
MATFREKLEELEDKHDIRICVHEWFEGSQGEITIYRLARDDSERDLPLPENFLDELSLMLWEKYSTSSFGKRLKGFLCGPSSISRFPFKLSPTSVTETEVNENQQAWNRHCALFNSCF